jgi:thiol peroxidase
MKTVLLKGNKVSLQGNFLNVGDIAPDFTLVNKELESVTLESFNGRYKILATVPSVDTPVCSQETKLMNDFAEKNPNAFILIISKDLPFALNRHCSKENLTNIIPLSDLRPYSAFCKNYGVLLKDGPLAGLMARSVIVLDPKNKVIYSELVSEITALPDLAKAFSII